MPGCTSPTSHSQRCAKGETASSTQKAHLRLTFLAAHQICIHLAGQVFAKATGRENRERRGRQLPVAGKAGKLKLRKRLSLYKSPQGAAIRSPKCGTSKQGGAGKPRRNSSACLVPNGKLNEILYLHIMSCRPKACGTLMLKKIRRENSNVPPINMCIEKGATLVPYKKAAALLML